MVLTPQGVGRVGRREGFFLFRDLRRSKTEQSKSKARDKIKMKDGRLKRQDEQKAVQSRDTQDRCESKTVVKRLDSAGVTQLVECHLAKVDVESSNLFSRSRYDSHLER
jgi:hypothetical protein